MTAMKTLTGLIQRLSERIALRAGQVDYFYTKHDFSSGNPGVASHQNNFRASVGIVFQFGVAHQNEVPHPRAHGAHPTATISIDALAVYVVGREKAASHRLAIYHQMVRLHWPDCTWVTSSIAVNGSPVKTRAELAAIVSGHSIRNQGEAWFP